MKKGRLLCRNRIETLEGHVPRSSPALECIECDICTGWNRPGGCGAKVLEMEDGTRMPLPDEEARYLPLEEFLGRRV